MFAKTFCKPGDFISAVPVGLQLTLQYNADGNLEKVFLHYDDDKVNVTSDLIQVLKRNSIVPSRVPIKNGTTWVKGVLYTSKIFKDEGTLPMCIESSMMKDVIESDASGYTFYAGNVHSLASSFKSVVVIRNWLSMVPFHVLPGFVVPVVSKEEWFFNTINNSASGSFANPLLISGFMIHRMGEFLYAPIQLNQLLCKRAVRKLDEHGYILASVQSKEDETSPLVLSYSDVIKFNIQPNSLVVTDEANKVIYAFQTDTKIRDSRSRTMTCSVCGKTFVAPLSGPVMCDDIHCRSRLYPEIRHFLSVLNLPEMSYDNFTKHIINGDIMCLTDVLLLPEYQDLKISTTLAKLLESVVPEEVCAMSSVFTMLANRCNNSVSTLMYYIKNTSRLESDLNMRSKIVERLIKWLSDGYNLTTIETLLESSNVSVLSTNKKFNGAPIFRGKTILITGRFLHGDMNEIISILESYDAAVVTQYSDKVDCLIIGQTKENIDGSVIQESRSAGIPVYDERTFFVRYEIDKDLKNNLL